MRKGIRTINIPVFVPHLGCPNDCVFCDQKQITTHPDAPDGAYVRSLIEATLSDIESIRSGCRVEAAFFGGSFTAIDEGLRTELLSAAYEYRDKIDGIRLSTRPDCIDDDILKELKRYGVTAIELGAQSMSEDVLTRSNRGHTAEDTRRAAKLIKSYGFSLVLQMMTGLPGDRRETSVYTAREIISLKPDGVRIYPAVVLPRTRMWDMAAAGEYIPQSVDEAVRVCAEIIPMFVNEGISVLRVGLMDNEILAEGNVKGAYHPALGELCYAEVFYNEARKHILKNSSENIVIDVPKGAVSKMIGHRGKNTKRLKDEFKIVRIKVREDDELRNFEVRVTSF